MGWSWSLHLCQRAVSHVVEQVIASDRLILDRCAGQVIAHRDDLTGAVYVDNFAVFGANPSKINACLRSIIKRFDQLGIPIHEVSDASTRGEFLGLELDDGIFTIKKRRLWKLKYAIETILQRRRASGHILEVLVEHVTWALMLRRDGLSIIDHCYRFVKDHHNKCVPMPPGVLRELRHIRALLPLFRASVHSEWSGSTHASDASPFGLGVLASRRDPQLIGTFGRTAEAWRSV